MRILLLIFVSFFAFTDDHDEMYQEGWAEYVYCSVKDGLSDQKAEQMFERRMKAFILLSNICSAFWSDKPSLTLQ